MPTLGTPRWFNEPGSSRGARGVLSVVTGHETDFWNNTFYGFRHTNGPFLGTPVTDEPARRFVTYGATHDGEPASPFG